MLLFKIALTAFFVLLFFKCAACIQFFHSRLLWTNSQILKDSESYELNSEAHELRKWSRHLYAHLIFFRGHRTTIFVAVIAIWIPGRFYMLSLMLAVYVVVAMAIELILMNRFAVMQTRRIHVPADEDT